ncbi:MAG: iron complex transport system permease protein [Hyphomonadaceae bacterium]|nr:MAG: iron complex transport system permease protein [Hyphomonadaceae bacterium]
MRQNNPQNWTIVSFLLLAILAIISLLIGRANFAFSEFLPSSPKYEAALLVLLEVRLPRTLFAILCGAALAVSGAALQGHLRNPLADAGVLGISSFASLGAIIAIYFGLSSLAFWVLPAMAIVFAWLSMALLLLIVGRDVTAIYFILAGVLLSTISGALMFGAKCKELGRLKFGRRNCTKLWPKFTKIAAEFNIGCRPFGGRGYVNKRRYRLCRLDCATYCKAVGR